MREQFRNWNWVVLSPLKECATLQEKPMPMNLVTDSALLQRLNAAAKRGVTGAESKRQRLSFVYGNLPKGSTMTRGEVEQVLERLDVMEGRG